jgi:hypothetical protein
VYQFPVQKRSNSHASSRWPNVTLKTSAENSM